MQDKMVLTSHGAYWGETDSKQVSQLSDKKISEGKCHGENKTR